jgi:hypothetical protein
MGFIFAVIFMGYYQRQINPPIENPAKYRISPN